MKWFVNSGWWLGASLRGSVTTAAIASLFSLVCLFACTDYVAEIDDQIKDFTQVVDPTEVVAGIMTDFRDGQTYNIVKIGGQVWMAENLNYETDNSSCYNDSAEYCDKYGRLYTWKAAMKACPSGWHLPSKEEFEVLINKVGGKVIVNQALKSTSGWEDDIEGTGNGTDAYGFSALPGGGRDGYSFHYEGNHAFFWSNTTTDCEYGNSACAYHILLSYTTRAEPHYYGLHFEYVGISESVRCLKD